MKNIYYALLLCLISSISVAQPPLSSGLLASYPFNGNALDNSGNNFNGIVNGATLTTDRFGRSNEAYMFDGNNDFIYCDSVIDPSSFTSMSISAWFYPMSIVVKNRNVGVSIGRKLQGEVALRVGNETSNTFQAILFNGTNLASSGKGHEAYSSTLPYNQWSHLVGVYQDNSVQLYLNNVAQTGLNVYGTGGKMSYVALQELLIGKAYNSNDEEKYFHGKIDDIRIYNRVLGPTDIDSLFQMDPFVGIDDKTGSTEATISCYPNPAEEILHIRSNESTMLNRLVITSIDGQVLVAEDLRNLSQYDLQLDAAFTSGLYFVQIEAANGQKWVFRQIIVK